MSESERISNREEWVEEWNDMLKTGEVLNDGFHVE